MIDVIIVDDEPIARTGIRDLLATQPDIRIVAECVDGQDALLTLAREPCDLLFLDVQMPGLTGFEVITALPAEERPVTIFVTAFDEFALNAFQVHAIDYLTKPIQRHRFLTALDRARAQLQYGVSADVIQSVQRLARSMSKNANARILLKSDGKALLVDPTDIERIEAEGNYARIFMNGRTTLIRETMAELSERLPDGFVRTHRSHIVNLASVTEIEHLFKGEYAVKLVSGATVPLTRKFRPLLEAALGREL